MRDGAERAAEVGGEHADVGALRALEREVEALRSRGVSSSAMISISRAARSTSMPRRASL